MKARWRSWPPVRLRIPWVATARPSVTLSSVWRRAKAPSNSRSDLSPCGFADFLIYTMSFACLQYTKVDFVQLLAAGPQYLRESAERTSGSGRCHLYWGKQWSCQGISQSTPLTETEIPGSIWFDPAVNASSWVPKSSILSSITWYESSAGIWNELLIPEPPSPPPVLSHHLLAEGGPVVRADGLWWRLV